MNYLFFRNYKWKYVKQEPFQTCTSYQEIAQKFGLTSSSSISTCIRRTICGYHWDRGEIGGALSYLSDSKSKKFFTLVKQYCADLNCLKTAQAFSIAYELREEQYRRTYYLMQKLNLRFHNYNGSLGS